MESTVSMPTQYVSKFRFLLKSCQKDFKGHMSVTEIPKDNSVDFLFMSSNPDVFIAIGYLIKEAETSPVNNEFNIRTSICLN